MKSKYSENIIFLIFLMLPIVDAINGFMVRTKGFYGVGSVYHLAFVIILLLTAYRNGKVPFGFYEKGTVVLIFASVGSIMVNSLFYEIESISMERIEKIICTALSITVLMRLIKNQIVSEKTIKKIVQMQCIMVPTITLAADLLGIANYTYQSAKVGRIGFYTGSNEPVAILTILGGILFVELSENFNLQKLFLFIETLLCLILVQSKLGYLMTAILLLSSVFLMFRSLMRKGRVKTLYLVVGSLVVIVGIVVGRDMLTKTLDAFLQRQAYQKKYLGESSFLDYISSGRTMRFKALLTPILDGNPFYVLFKLLFGQGARFGYSETFEMDYFDAFLYGGVFMTVCLLWFTYKALKSAKKKSGVLLEIIVLIFIYAFVGGHVWTGGVSGLYLALLLAYCATINDYKIKKYGTQRI